MLPLGRVPPGFPQSEFEQRAHRSKHPARQQADTGMALQPCGKFQFEQRHLHCACPRAALPDDLRRLPTGAGARATAVISSGLLFASGVWLQHRDRHRTSGIGRAGPDRLAQRLARYLAYWSLKPLQQFGDVARRLDEHRAIADQLVAPARGAAGQGAPAPPSPSPRLPPARAAVIGGWSGVWSRPPPCPWATLCQQQPARAVQLLPPGRRARRRYVLSVPLAITPSVPAAAFPARQRAGGLLHRSPPPLRPEVSA